MRAEDDASPAEPRRDTSGEQLRAAEELHPQEEWAAAPEDLTSWMGWLSAPEPSLCRYPYCCAPRRFYAGLRTSAIVSWPFDRPRRPNATSACLSPRCDRDA